VTSNVTPITHLLYAEALPGRGRTGGNLLLRAEPRSPVLPRRLPLLLPRRYIGAPLYAFRLFIPPSAVVATAATSCTTSPSPRRLPRNNPRHRQVCEGMNEKLQGGLAKFLLRPPRPSAVLSSLAGSAPDGIGNYSPNAPRRFPTSLPSSHLPPASLPIRSLIYLQFRAVMRCRCENRGQPVGGVPLLSRREQGVRG